MPDLGPKAFTHAEVVHMYSVINEALEGKAADRVWALKHIRDHMTDSLYNGATDFSEKTEIARLRSGLERIEAMPGEAGQIACAFLAGAKFNKPQ